MKKSNKAFQLTIALMAIIFILSACTDPKDEIINTLEGKWEVESWLYQNYYNNSEWIELVPSTFENAIVKFEEYENGEGNFEWRYTQNSYGTTTLQGEYECNTAGDEIELNFDDSYYGDKVPIEISLNGDNLILRGNVFDGNMIISTKRQ